MIGQLKGEVGWLVGGDDGDEISELGVKTSSIECVTLCGFRLKGRSVMV